MAEYSLSLSHSSSSEASGRFLQGLADVEMELSYHSNQILLKMLLGSQFVLALVYKYQKTNVKCLIKNVFQIVIMIH